MRDIVFIRTAYNRSPLLWNAALNTHSDGAVQAAFHPSSWNVSIPSRLQAVGRTLKPKLVEQVLVFLLGVVVHAFLCFEPMAP
jgi:hypothetical protein